MENVEVNEENRVHHLKKERFQLKKNKNGLLLTIHHTTESEKGTLRIRFVNCCFNDDNSVLIAIDHRGNVFTFNFLTKYFWKTKEQILKCKSICNVSHKSEEFVIGTKTGKILIFDSDAASTTRTQVFSKYPILGISFPSSHPTKPHLNFLIHTNREAILINYSTLTQSHRLEYNESKTSINSVAFIPNSDKLLACFRNDSVHIWSGVTLSTIRIVHPVRMRDRYLKANGAQQVVISSESETELDVALKGLTKDFSRGVISSCSFSPNGQHVCLTTIDDYIVVLSTVTYDIIKLIRLQDNSCENACFLPQVAELMLFLLTSTFDVVLLDCDSFNGKAIVQKGNSYKMLTSNNGKMLAIILKTGEIQVYATSALLNILKQTQKNINITANIPQKHQLQQQSRFDAKIGAVDDEIKATLSRKRLVPILNEFSEYPEKYRPLIWQTLLHLPCNKAQYMELLKKGLHPLVENYDQRYPLRDISALRNLKKTMSCLIHWCKVFGHSDFLPGFVFPFLKVFQKSQMMTFELLVTILLNHCYLWFEFCPLEPMNYLGMVANALTEFDPDLVEFYTNFDIKPSVYAWSLMSTAFSEVLDERQWYQLWDNIITNQPYFLVFCIIAYNIVQKPVIKRLTTRESVEEFFHDQNIVDMRKMLKKASSLMEICPDSIHPRRYIKKFEKLPQGFYPKFDNYPKDWVEVKDNEMETLRLEREILDKKIRELEMVEKSLAKRLEDGLKLEEHQKRMKEVEKLYGEAIAKEEERTACQRKMLLLYQKQIRDRKAKILDLVRDSTYRRNLNLRENELDTLLRTIERSRAREETDMMFADEYIKIHELNILSKKYDVESRLLEDEDTFRTRFSCAIKKLEDEKQKLSTELENLKDGGCQTKSAQGYDIRRKISAIESMLEEIQIEFIRTIERNGDNGGKEDRLKLLESEIYSLEADVKQLLRKIR